MLTQSGISDHRRAELQPIIQDEGDRTRECVCYRSIGLVGDRLQYRLVIGERRRPCKRQCSRGLLRTRNRAKIFDRMRTGLQFLSNERQ